MTRAAERVTRAALAVAAALSPALAARWAEALFFTPPCPRKSRSLLPPGADRLAVQSRAGGLAVWSWGSGPAVYLVHGWGGRAEQLGAFVAPLVSRGFRVIAVDGPGHGASAGRRSSGVEIGRALADVVAQLGPARAVIAHSLGAAAVTFAVREGLRVERLVFIGAAANPLTWVERFGRRLGLSRAVMAEMRRHSETRIQARWEDLPLVPLRSLGEPPPLLVVHDRDDREVPFADGAEIAAVWPGARFLETSGLGHRRVLRDPAVVEAVVDFVAAGVARPIDAPGPGGDAMGREGTACVHDPEGEEASCEACALEAELFTPALRRLAPALPVWP